MWVDHMVDHFSTYIYQKRGFYYFSRRVPKEVQHCHAKQRIVLALNTRSRAKALKYCDGKICNANSASAALNKWMKATISGDYVVHGLRHSLRDRLRAVECPSDIIDQIGGWSRKGVGASYGRGYQVEQLWSWMVRAVG